MRYSTFMTSVEQAAGHYARGSRARERITRGEAEDIALFLLRSALTSAPEPAEAFERDDFIRRVAEPEGVDEETRGARAQRTTLRCSPPWPDADARP